MPLNKTNKPIVKIKQKTFQCIKKEDSYIYGDFNSNSGRMIRIKVNRCVDKSYCKSEKEINDFFGGKYLLFMNNQFLQYVSGSCVFTIIGNTK